MSDQHLNNNFDNTIFLNCYYLFDRPSFLEGMARVLDIGSTLQNYNYSDTEELADYIALYSDWYLTGKDIKLALDNYGGSKRETTQKLQIAAAC